jgi:hypothetical protein
MGLGVSDTTDLRRVPKPPTKMMASITLN